MKKCQFCGKELPDDNTFCTSCGTYCESGSIINNENVHDGKKVLSDFEQRRMGNVFAWISVLIYFSMSEIYHYTETIFKLPGKVGTFFALMVGLGLVLYGTVKYPKCSFVKICLFLYTLLAIGLLRASL